MQRGSIIALLGALAMLPAFCQAASSEVGDWKIDPHAELELDSTYYPSPLAPTNQFLETAQLGLPTTFRYQHDFKLRFDPVFQADPLNNSITERYWFDAPEGFAQYQHEGWTTQIGYNVFTWGVTDGFNPLDIVSARREQDPLRPQKLGAPSVTLKKDIDNFSFEGIFIPWQRQTVLPGIDSRWLPRQVVRSQSFIFQGETGTLNLPANINYSYLPYVQKDNALEKNYGFRSQVQGLVEGLDASLEYFEGAAPVPAVLAVVNATGTQLFPSYALNVEPNIQLQAEYYRQRVFGGSLVYANFGSIFRFEAAITRLISEGQELPGNSEAYVLGVERPFPLGPDALTVLVQGTYVRQTIPIQNATTDLSRVFDRAALCGLRYAFNEKFTVLGSALFDTESHGEYAHLEGGYALSDSVKLGLAGDDFWGAAATPTGTYNKNERVIASVKTSF